MPAVPSASLHHIALTVNDLDASVAWYEKAFGVAFLMEEPHPGGTGKVLADPERRLMIVLHRHDTHRGEPFAETRTGLDHAGFAVGRRADLEAWQAHLEANGVARAPRADRPLTQSPIVDRPYGSVLTFRDPDNIQLELIAPPGP